MALCGRCPPTSSGRTTGTSHFEEDRDCGEIQFFIPFGESTDLGTGSQWNNPVVYWWSNEPWEIYHLAERGETLGRV